MRNGDNFKICVSRSITDFGDAVFKDVCDLATVVFESNSRLTAIPQSAFSGCFGLVAIALPASVETLSRGCFEGFNSLRALFFEPHS
jgi:hypothetical protein